MTDHTPLTAAEQIHAARPPRALLFNRAKRYAGGAATGMVVSVAAAYAVVSTLAPHPAKIVAERSGDHAIDEQTPTLARFDARAHAVARPAENVAPLRDAAVAPLLPSPAPEAVLPPATSGAFMNVTFARPETVPPARPVALGSGIVATSIVADRAHLAAPRRPVPEEGPSTAVVAALSHSDAANRAGAPISAPQPRPEALLASMTAPAAEIAAVAPMVPGLRPEPRPNLTRVADATPAPGGTPEALRLAGADTCGPTLARAIPNRRSGAATGSDFLSGLSSASGSSRDRAIIDELARGNMPGFLQNLWPVTLNGQDSRGNATEIVICVTPDYLALGSDRDFVRVPLGLPAAASIARSFDMTLPTPRMVDAIFAQAEVRLSPSPMEPGPQMSSTPYFVRHNATIENQRDGARGLISGHKKDVVMASRMASAPGRVAIYGWHRTSGKPIQPVSTVHGASYADYSHGIRLVSTTAFLNGKPVALDELLSSARYAYLLNKDGPMPGSVIRIAAR